MTTALVGAVLMNQGSVPADVLRATLEKTTQERDAARAALANAGANSGPPATTAVEVSWTDRAVRIRLLAPADYRVSLGETSHSGRARELLLMWASTDPDLIAGRALAADMPDVERFVVKRPGSADAAEPALPTKWLHAATFDSAALRLQLPGGGSVQIGSGMSAATLIIDGHNE